MHPNPFFAALIKRCPELEGLRVTQVANEKWHGLSLYVEPPDGAGLAHGLEIELVDDEVSIALDHSHVHLGWAPDLYLENPEDAAWFNEPLLMIEGLLREEIVACSGWRGDHLAIGCFHLANTVPDLIIPGIVTRRTRSWRGQYKRDEKV